jgi:HPt (histidine-containing phosphotransfer) domain-containing protein
MQSSAGIPAKPRPSNAAADNPPSRHLDPEQLRRLTLGDRELERELLGLFRVQARVQFKLISMARKATDFDLAVHTLKGAALAVGATAIADFCKRLEALGFADDQEQRRELVRSLAEELTAAEAEIAEIIG